MIARKQLGHITAAMAEAEPEAERLFSRKPRRISPETRALFERIEAQRASAGHKSNQ